MKKYNILKRMIKKYKSKTREINRIREIDYKTLQDLIRTDSNTELVDVRSTQEFLEGRLNNAINIPLYELNKNAENILKDKNKPIILYCQVGVRSKKAYKILKEKGYRNLYMLEGGLDNI